MFVVELTVNTNGSL